ncbi:peptidyl-prolyl cis-trans isomerase SurA [Caulobacter ginsengisoli]|uniref:Parvulin-like PPIase n=1 Tax=Caulobacter ginsengisoli TaxID=400775 RepID=A0ABU0IPX8_9CAUL|nr:peptidylprolyl isomerase [Caulobacter ginsengisoli]MDQ0464062.1 peptidyl-prolyl cis-trans isomerase SurA [Caulobacter ginsengisoli]
MSVLALASAGLPPLAQAQTPPVAPSADPGLSEGVAATVNDEIISTYDLVQRMRLIMVTSGIQPTEDTIPQLQREALRSLVDEHLQLQELRRVEKENKIDIVATDAEVNDQIASWAKDNNSTGDQMLARLAAQGVGAETLKSQIRVDMSWQQYIRGRFGQRLKIGDDQVKATIQRLSEEATKPQYQVSEIYIDAARVGGMDTAVQGAQSLIEQMQAGAPFASVARQFSSSTSAANGGDAGWITSGEMPTEVDQVLDQLRPGQLSRPIQTQDGVYIIYLKDKRSGASATLVNLKQIAVPLEGEPTAEQLTAAQATLEKVRPLVTGCADLESKTAGIEGILAGDLGEVDISTLTPAFADAATNTPIGQLSQAVRSPGGLHLVMVCGRRQSGADALTPEQVENRLRGQQLSLIERRVMRDLRNSATIEMR